MRTIIDGWDAFELWVTQLAFPFQVLLVIVVLLPLCGLVATLVDRVTERFDTPASERRASERPAVERPTAGRSTSGRTVSAPKPGDDVS
ncbi:MAG: hypothetical protein L0I76_30140 [Pseudonocardia sp.]|nr:hypothetical protein [Pseudonocardia sp.]